MNKLIQTVFGLALLWSPLGHADAHAIYDAVCHTSDLSYFIFVAKPNEKGLYKVVIRDRDSADQDAIVRRLFAKRIHRRVVGQHNTYIGLDFSLDVRADKYLPGGGGHPGLVRMKVSGRQVHSEVACQLFPGPN